MPICSPETVTAYQLQPVWPVPSPALQAEVVQFWQDESALPDRTNAESRARELLVVARHDSGRIAGVSTAARTFVPWLGFACFFYRTYVGRDHRTRGLHSAQLAKRVLQRSYLRLNERFQQGCDRQVLGLYAEIENANIERVRNEAVWQDDGMNAVYIGRTPQGNHLRIWYFDGARIP